MTHNGQTKKCFPKREFDIICSRGIVHKNLECNYFGRALKPPPFLAKYMGSIDSNTFPFFIVLLFGCTYLFIFKVNICCGLYDFLQTQWAFQKVHLKITQSQLQTDFLWIKGFIDCRNAKGGGDNGKNLYILYFTNVID